MHTSHVGASQRSPSETQPNTTMHAEYCVRASAPGRLVKGQLTRPSDLTPSVAPANVSELRDKPTHRERDPTTQPASLRSTEKRMQGLRGCLHLRAQPPQEHLQGLRGRLHLRPPPIKEQVQRLQATSLPPPARSYERMLCVHDAPHDTSRTSKCSRLMLSS